MEQHKNTMEQDFREKLSQREIMPSDKAWDRLDAMLAVAEEKKSKRGYGWLYIAASICGFLAIGAAFLGQTEEVVDQGRPIVFENKIAPEQSPEAVTTVTPTIASEAIASSERPEKYQKDSPHASTGELTKQSKSIANQSPQTKTIINQNPVEAVTMIEDQKLIASTNQIQKPERPFVKVDELLAQAQSNSANPKTSVKVSAKNLLSEVDRDVNQSFREKMLRRAGEVANTVANRNNE